MIHRVPLIQSLAVRIAFQMGGAVTQRGCVLSALQLSSAPTRMSLIPVFQFSATIQHRVTLCLVCFSWAPLRPGSVGLSAALLVTGRLSGELRRALQRAAAALQEEESQLHAAVYDAGPAAPGAVPFALLIGRSRAVRLAPCPTGQ